MSTFGNTTIESTAGSSSGTMQAFQFTLSEPGTLQSISAYLVPGTAGDAWTAAVYTDTGSNSPVSLVAHTGTGSLNVGDPAGWKTLNLTTTPKIAAGTYWLVWEFLTGQAGFRYTSTGGHQAYAGYTFSNLWPSSFGSATYNTSLGSIYCTYSPNNPPYAPIYLSATTNSLTPTFTGSFSDPDAGDTLGGVEIVVTRHSDGVQMWDSGELAASGSSFSKGYAGSALAANTQYDWKARTWDNWGAAGPYSTLQSFTIVQVPNAPSSLSPTGRVITLTPAFSFAYSDPNGYALAGYEIILYASDQATIIWDSGALTSDDGGAVAGHSTVTKTYPGSPALAWGTQYYWKARVQSNAGGSPWSSYTSLVGMNTNAYPTQPTAMNPATGAIIRTLTPQLAATFNDPDTGDTPTAHHIQVLNNGTGATVVDRTVTNTNQYEQIVAGDSLAWETWYKWRINYTDTGSLVGAWSDWATFKPTQGPSAVLNWPPVWREDTFTRANSASSLGSSESAAAASEAWVAVAGTWGISSNQGYCATAAALAMATLTGVANGDLSCDVVWATGTTCGTVFRQQDTSNYWRAVITGAALSLIKRVAGTDTTVGSYAFTPVNGTTYTVRVVHSGTSITAYLNGTSQITATSQTDLQAATGAGLFSDNSTAPLFDNFSLKDLYVETPVTTYTWTYSHPALLAQQSYELIVYASDGVTVVWDSGIVYSAATSVQQPYGYLQNGTTYKMQVTVWCTDGTSGQSSLVSFTTAWTPPADITGVTVTANNAAGRIDVSWTASALGSSVFLQYNLYVSRNGGAWTLHTKIPNKATTVYSYYEAASGDSVALALTQTEVFFTTTLESANKVSGSAVQTLDRAWLTEAANPGTYQAQLQYMPKVKFSPTKDVVDLLLFGRRATVRHEGLDSTGTPICYEQASSTFRLTGDALHAADTYLAMLKSLNARATTCMFRDEWGQRLYVNWDLQAYEYLTPRGIGYNVTLTLVETDYTPPVEVLS